MDRVFELRWKDLNGQRVNLIFADIEDARAKAMDKLALSSGMTKMQLAKIGVTWEEGNTLYWDKEFKVYAGFTIMERIVF